MKNLIKSPAEPVGKGSKKGGPGVYDGKHSGPAGAYPRSKSKDGVPEKQIENH